MDDFIKTLIAEVKSQGVFDEFRFNCCLADVDTKPAYQNVRNRVEAAVNDFLAKQQWTPETNKVQLRERLRKHLLDSDVLDKGVDQIVDQVVNPKVATIFEPKIESIVYKYLGITPPPPPPPRPAMLPAPPLPPFPGHMNGSSLLNVETTAGLLPTDLEQISPDSDRATVKSEVKDDELPPGVDDEDTSPSYELVNEEKPSTSKEELNSGSLNNSDSVNGVSQASQLSQVSSDSRLTIGSSTESMADAQQPATALNSGKLANISEEAQMPKFSENSSEASAGAGENGSSQLHFDIKQDAITFEGTERKNSVSKDTNGGPQILSIEDAIMSEVKANIDDANNASIESMVEPETIQPPPLPSIEPAQPAPPLEPPPAPQPVEPPPPPPPENVPPPPPLDVVPPPPPAEVVPPPPPAPLPVEPPPPPAPPKLEPPSAPQPVEISNGSVSETVLAATPKETDDLNRKPNAVDAEVKKEDKLKATPEIKEVKPPKLAPPQEVETPKEEVTKSSESTASSVSVSSQSRSHSKSSNKEKERRHHSHSDDKHRRRSRSRDRDRDRDRDRSRDKSHTKHSSSSSSKHSSSHSSSSKHRSSSSKNDKNSSSSSSRSNHESSSSKRSSTSSSSRHESSSHKKHKSSSSSSRSDRDKDKEREKDQSRSHHSSSSSSSSSKRKDHDRKDRDRDRNKSSSSGNGDAKAVQDDHNESKAKLIKRRSSDSNDEGKPPSSGGPAKISQPEVTAAAEKADATVENGNGTNGNSNGSSNGVSNSVVSASNVIIVSDILQQSSTSFIQLTAGSQSHKVLEESKPEPEDIDGGKADNQPEKPGSEESASHDEAPRVDPPKADKTESVPDSPAEENKEGAGLEHEPVETYEKEKPPAEETIPENPVDIVETTSQLADLPKDDEKPATQPADSNEQSDELVADCVTHFEENTDEFKERLQLINQLIEDRKNLLDRLSADGSQGEAVDVRALRRSISKRRRSSLQEQPPEVRESTPARHCSPSSSTSGSPAKRLRRDEPKSSPTPSDASINSKENEALEKQEHAV
ncbi:histone-lysine N-methyltransferase SETD1B isoform X2 [Drosophila biarmipes]|uniref:histone-lysine N-methyltransferase SETD1B isoform X2 n=1 Tax=Drosophila biarmipes TaxID=125945 RepID=UPI0007E87115|nr:histone-lysine N-methyltransferase SETD1B isoform X2 [Drosophila biarmipes]